MNKDVYINVLKNKIGELMEENLLLSSLLTEKTYELKKYKNEDGEVEEHIIKE